ncbi:MAG: PilN domain-containing protein [Capsulimonadales bacterium]|nr:PilN domain-containing protein [Capsulimonadales bacterium]
MSGKRQPSLYIEWSPGRVRAMETVGRRQASGETLSDIVAVLGGHRDALIGIGRGTVFLKTLSLPKAMPEDLRRLVSVRIGEMFPLPADQLSFDLLQTGERTPEGFLTLIAAVRADDLRMLQSELKRANLQAVRILPVALGSVAVAARAGVSSGIVLETGPYGLTMDTIGDGGLRFSRLAAPNADPAQEARRTLLAFGTPDGRIVTAGSLTLPGAIAREETSLELLSEAPPFGFELSEDRQRVAQRRAALRTRLALLLMLSAFLLIALVWADRHDAQAVVTRGQGQWTRELNRLRSIRDTQNARTQTNTAIETVLDRAFETRQPLADVAAVVGDSLPPSSWLTALILERGKPVQIRATTTNETDVARCLRTLAASGRFRDVKLIFANSGRISETPVVQYSITAVAIGNLPLPEPPKKNSGNRTNRPPVTSAKAKEPKDSRTP